MKAHCPKCGKFARAVNEGSWKELRGFWLWKRIVLVREWEYYCRRCDHYFVIHHEERLR